MFVAIVIAAVVAVVVLIPTRRLQLAGWSRDSLVTYFVAVWLLGIVVALEPAPTRLLVPILLVAYLAPFITIRAGIDRLFGGHMPGKPAEPVRPPVKNVTPPDERDPGAPSPRDPDRPTPPGP